MDVDRGIMILKRVFEGVCVCVRVCMNLAVFPCINSNNVLLATAGVTAFLLLICVEVPNHLSSHINILALGLSTGSSDMNMGMSQFNQQCPAGQSPSWSDNMMGMDNNR